MAEKHDCNSSIMYGEDLDQVPLLDNDDTLGFGEEDEPKGRLKHPMVTLFHLMFRTAALVVYELCGFVSNGFIGPFITIVILLSMDFWTVKNITGRLMVGLRWWNYIDDEGQSHWVFEARKVSQCSNVCLASCFSRLTNYEIEHCAYFYHLT
ncbi:uncharacterized Golgi apparatus membrane protein-like protein CG5021 isoform X2 [Cherax quadricarinatus]|uniref:uncharacterized Golgi apparatus membrane protein-like protein CG5021 isoform X2 n=1 Tax=Cherax quadricarinatus TaxID=27406 RepID=UPI00387E45EF